MLTRVNCSLLKTQKTTSPLTLKEGMCETVFLGLFCSSCSLLFVRVLLFWLYRSFNKYCSSKNNFIWILFTSKLVMIEEEDLEEYKYQANLKKDAGNVAFEDGNTELSISLFTQAIDIDPDNVVFYSNRSAAYMKVDSVSKALHDAEKCVELDPKWPKGYNRLGVAQQKLKRFDAAIDSFKKGEIVRFYLVLLFNIQFQELNWILTIMLCGLH